MLEAVVIATIGLWIGVGLVVGVEVARWLRRRTDEEDHDR